MNTKYLPLIRFYKIIRKVLKNTTYRPKTFQDFISESFPRMLFVSCELQSLRNKYLQASKIKKIKNYFKKK